MPGLGLAPKIDEWFERVKARSFYHGLLIAKIFNPMPLGLFYVS